jgi:predicted lipoprotein with Yx(FWY)xxD motif
MQRCTALRITAVLLTLAALGCSGYSNGLGISKTDAAMLDSSTPTDAASTSHPPDAARPEPDAGTDATNPEADAAPVIDASPPTMPDEMDASAVMPVDAAPATPIDASPADLRLEMTMSIDGYITDSAGDPLYMFIGDVTRSNETACLSSCASTWPPFDATIARVATGLDLAQVARFHRQDGAWQTTYKGHPLYRRESEAGTQAVTSDGVDGRWFVARDYLVFMSAARTFAPAGGMGLNGPFLTDGLGRTLYVCLEDEPATAMVDPQTTCSGDCLTRRPVFGPMGDANARVPSLIDANDLKTFIRADGTRQFMYRGWPLYYFSGDAVAGATEGHNDGAWRAFDPVGFGLQPQQRE